MAPSSALEVGTNVTGISAERARGIVEATYGAEVEG